MATDDITLKKVFDAVEDDLPLPSQTSWDQLALKPDQLSDIDPDAAAALEDIENDFLTLGDLAYLDSITTTQITDNSITTPKLQAGAVTASKMSVGSLGAITATIGEIYTASSGERIRFNSGATNRMEFLYNSTLYGLLEVDRISSSVGHINLGLTSGGVLEVGLQIDTDVGASGFNSADIGSNGGSLFTNGNASNGYVGMSGKNGGSFYIHGGPSGDEIVTDIGVASDWEPFSDNTYDLGSSGNRWRTLYLANDLNVGDDFNYQNVRQPIVYYGYVNSGGSSGSPFPSGWSVSWDSNGVYTVTHGFGSSTSYTVDVVARASTVKNISISSRSSSSFTVRVANLSDVLEDNDFMFVVFRNA